MDRLVDKKGSAAGAEARLVELVAACEPVRVSEARKQRSLGAVYARHHERRRTVRLAMRLAMAAGVLLAAGAATAAVFGVRFRAHPAPAPVALAPAPAPRHAVHAPRVAIAD
ncbi:MAG TPA: hypothetical protein VHO06_28175, partial [Polyangia bacterium]|nr:hypothetical protein [Polyangia bacterium]